MSFEVEIKTFTNKEGKTYECIYIKQLDKRIFLSSSELELLKIKLENNI